MEVRRNDVTIRMPDRAVSLPEGGIVVREIGSLSDHGGDIPTAYRHLRLFVVDGVLEAVVDGKSYRLQRGDFLDCFGCTVSLRCASSEARAYLLLMTESYLGMVLKDKRPFSPRYLLHILQHPVQRISPIDYSVIIRGMENVRQAIAAVSCRYSQDILQSKVLIFILELSDILDRENHFPSPNESAKYQRLFADFLRMLPEHIRREHTVTFYAGLLNITPQYLRRIVRGLSGRSAYQIISDYLNREVCKLLLETSLTLQEIADELNFSDQAVLSKFFKRCNGVSPLKYRNEQK